MEMELLINDLDFYQFANEVGELPIQRIYLRDITNPIDFYNDHDFFVRFRFSKFTILNVVFPILRESLENGSARGLPLLPMIKLLTVIRFYATGSFQIVCADAVGVNQSTVSRLIKLVSRQLALQLSIYVKFPEDLVGIKSKFYEMARFPGVVGCIDCTHVPIASPGGERAESFRNRKGWFSINVQAVVDPKGKFHDLLCRWPGSVHDSRIFDNSSLKAKMEQNQIDGLLLGDSGYGQTEYLFTPVPEPINQRQIDYNISHRSTRNVVERCFGRWKRRFPCLSRKLATKLPSTTMIIAACAVLHNISIDVNEGLPDVGEDANVNALAVPVNPPADNVRGRAALIRNAFINVHF